MKEEKIKALVCFDELGVVPKSVALQVEESICPHIDDENISQWEDRGWVNCVVLGKSYYMRTHCPYLIAVTKGVEGEVFIHCKK